MRLAFTLIIFLGNSLCAQKGPTIEGTWILERVNSETIIECADVITFNGNGNYAILNDCYGIDAKRPVIESGTWNYDAERMVITLSNRDFVTDISDYVYRDNAQILTLELREIGDNRMVICFNHMVNCQLEEYYRASN